MRANTGADEAGYEREVLLLAAGLPFILQRMRKRPGYNTAPTPLSALQVLRGVRRVHKRLGGVLMLRRGEPYARSRGTGRGRWLRQMLALAASALAVGRGSCRDKKH